MLMGNNRPTVSCRRVRLSTRPPERAGVEPNPAYRVVDLGLNLRRQGRLHGIGVTRLDANRKTAQGRTAAVIDRPEVDLAVIRTIAHAHHR